MLSTADIIKTNGYTWHVSNQKRMFPLSVGVWSTQQGKNNLRGEFCLLEQTPSQN